MSNQSGPVHGHVLYGRLRPYLNKVLSPDFAGHCSTEIFPIAPRPGLQREYLRYWLQAGETVQRINATCTGARMPRADMNEVLDFTIPLPPLPEQQRIVARLDEAFAGIATARAHAEQNLRNARALFESQLQAVFSQRGEGREETTIDKISANLDNKRIPITKSDRKSGEYPYYGAS
ncbi:MAG: restriction endonuclease subunit S, partial [Planctomyces sp.]|nr:restriction endonuclease subunit S [Planctomyces sp.]